MPYPVRIELQCLRLERMLSEEIVVTEMAVNVCVSWEQDMMALVTLKSTWDIICTDLRTGNLVNINFHTASNPKMKLAICLKCCLCFNRYVHWNISRRQFEC